MLSLSQNKKKQSCSWNFTQHRSFWRKLPTKKRIGPHNLDVISVLFGSLLGDGHAEKRSNATRIHIHMSQVHEDYLLWLHKFLSKRGYCSPTKQKIRCSKNKQGKSFYSCHFVTYSFSRLNWLFDLFYSGGKKVVPKNIFDFLNRQALAIWFMDDGGKSGVGLVLHTDCFDDQDLYLLQQVVWKKFQIKLTKQKKKKGFKLYISKNQVSLFSHWIKPYMIPSMFYKLHQ